MRRYLRVLQLAGIYVLLLPVNGMLAHGSPAPHTHSPPTPTPPTPATSTRTRPTPATPTPSPATQTSSAPTDTDGDGISDSDANRAEYLAKQKQDTFDRVMNQGRERRETEERERSEREESEARERGDTARADAISRARERGISNNYGQRDRFVEREADRIQKAIRQDRIDREVRQSAVDRGDTAFVTDIDRARDRRYGEGVSAVESDRRRYDATLDPATIEQRAEGRTRMPLPVPSQIPIEGRNAGV